MRRLLTRLTIDAANPAGRPRTALGHDVIQCIRIGGRPPPNLESIAFAQVCGALTSPSARPGSRHAGEARPAQNVSRWSHVILDRDHRNRSIAITENDRWRSPKTVHRDRSGQSGPIPELIAARQQTAAELARLTADR
jgi:hypothetical protein